MCVGILRDHLTFIWSSSDILVFFLTFSAAREQVTLLWRLRDTWWPHGFTAHSVSYSFLTECCEASWLTLSSCFSSGHMRHSNKLVSLEDVRFIKDEVNEDPLTDVFTSCEDTFSWNSSALKMCSFDLILFDKIHRCRQTIPVSVKPPGTLVQHQRRLADVSVALVWCYFYILSTACAFSCDSPSAIELFLCLILRAKQN